MPFSLSKFLITFTIFPVAVALQIYPCARHSNEQLPYFSLYEICIFCAFKGIHGQEIAVEIYYGEKWPVKKKLSPDLFVYTEMRIVVHLTLIENQNLKNKCLESEWDIPLSKYRYKGCETLWYHFPKWSRSFSFLVSALSCETCESTLCMMFWYK